MTFPTRNGAKPAEQPALRTEAPAAHMDALFRILEETDQALEPMTSRGMDGRTASILREIEKSGAIAVQTDGDDLWVDVIDRKKALSIVDALLQSYAQK
ncbi:hypothetical protein [Ponticaulis sp.]|uniref:hypothetical protein n=1 Tax=Ponticaulis sp. TaxID=2020902 RepID=UPI0025FC5EDC|nr:hypothetical protein [Ponticaulis sp.]